MSRETPTSSARRISSRHGGTLAPDKKTRHNIKPTSVICRTRPVRKDRPIHTRQVHAHEARGLPTKFISAALRHIIRHTLKHASASKTNTRGRTFGRRNPAKQTVKNINKSHQDMHVSWLQVNEHRTQSWKFIQQPPHPLDSRATAGKCSEICLARKETVFKYNKDNTL